MSISTEYVYVTNVMLVINELHMNAVRTQVCVPVQVVRGREIGIEDMMNPTIFRARLGVPLTSGTWI